jgi:hypothetical protein
MSRRGCLSYSLLAGTTPDSKRFFRGATLATTLGVMVCAQAGCLIPQDIEKKIEAPHPAPSIVVSTIPSYLLPPKLTLIRQGASDPPCHCTLLFDGLEVEEVDSTVALEAHWFVDYDTAVPSSTRIVASDILAPNFDDVTKTIRALRPFTFDADDVGITASGVHIVEVVVGETAGFDRTSVTQPNRAMKEGYTPAVYRFAVDVHLEQVPGQCPTTPPSKLTCP